MHKEHILIIEWYSRWLLFMKKELLLSAFLIVSLLAASYMILGNTPVGVIAPEGLASDTSIKAVEARTVESYVVESAHPYTNNFDYTWTITKSGATQIRVHFTKIELESNYDYLYVYDYANAQLQKLTGTYSSGGWSSWSYGETIKVRLDTDYSVTKWGFKIDQIEYEGGGGGGGDNILVDGVTSTSSLSATGATEMWTIQVEADATVMYSVLTCSSADFDLYGRRGAEPTTSTYDWRGYTSGGEEVTFNNPGAGTWYIMVRSYSGSGSYGLTVTLTYGGGGGGDNELESGVPVTSSLAAQYATEMWTIEVGANALSMYSVLTCGSADFDLYGRRGAEPTTSTYDWRGYTSGGEEVTFNSPGAGTWYVMVRSYSGTGSYSLTVTLTYSGPDTTPPAVTINSPANGATVSGTTTISFTATDANGISSRAILIDGSQVSTSSSYSWVTTGYADGSSHTIRCQATDPSGNTGYSQISVTVDNSGGGGGDGIVTRWAVIVGISDYKAISDLSYCDEDATDWYNYLVNVMDYNNVRVLGDTHTSNYPSYYAVANEYNVKACLSWMVSGADEDDKVAFITSGHGSGTGTGSSYLCMWDCSSGENGQDGNLYDTELDNYIGDMVASNIFIFIDHCYSGGFIPEMQALSNSANIYITTTCTQNGYGYDDSAHQNGAWTYYFLQYGLINHYGSNPGTYMETCFDYALAAYPYGGGDTPQEFDGNTGVGFTL